MKTAVLIFAWLFLARAIIGVSFLGFGEYPFVVRRSRGRDCVVVVIDALLAAWLFYTALAGEA